MVGAGVIGLTCAIRLAEAGHTVDVLARELPLETTSAVAGGLWLPYLAEPVDQVSRWGRRTFEVLHELAADGGGPGRPATGIALREGYLLGRGPVRPAWAPGLAGLIELSAVVNPAPGHSEGWLLRVPLVDMTAYLPYLVQRLRAASGTLTRLPLTMLPSRGLVVNCTGLAARALAADPDVHPVGGQVVWLSNPGLNTWWSDDSGAGSELTYVLPHARHIVVGGTSEPDNWSTDPQPRVAERIVERARDLVPALRAATVLSHRVGLRPVRPAVRLETVHEPERTLVHCYGHGGSGVTLSWGCADDVLAAVDAVVTPAG